MATSTEMLPDELARLAANGRVRRRVVASDLTPAKRAALARGGVREGSILIEDAPSPALRLLEEQNRATRLNTYRGTQVMLKAHDAGEPPQIHREIAESLRRIDPRPLPRLAHYGWTEANGLRIVGWTAGIHTIRPYPQGGWLVDVEITPLLVHPNSGVIQTRDSCIERYHYRDGTLRFIALQANSIFSGPDSLLVD